MYSMLAWHFPHSSTTLTGSGGLLKSFGVDAEVVETVFLGVGLVDLLGLGIAAVAVGTAEALLPMDVSGQLLHNNLTRRLPRSYMQDSRISSLLAFVCLLGRRVCFRARL